MGGKKGGIFQEWFKNITMLIFLQSFHAVFLAFIVNMIGAITEENYTVENIKDVFSNKEAILSILTIVSMMSLIKMEKMIKGIFGINDSKFLGGIGENLSKSIASIGSGIAMAKRTAEPFKQRNEARKKGMDARAAQAKGRIDQQKAQKELDDLKTAGPGTLSNDEYQRKLAKAEDKVDKAKASIKENKEIEKQAKLDEDLAQRKAYTRLGSTVASAGVAIGATEDIGKAAVVANLMDAPLDYMGDKYVEKRVLGKKSKDLEDEIEHEKENLARKRVKSANPGIDESSASFRQKVYDILNDEDFKKEVEIELAPKFKAKYDVDKRIPRKEIAQAAKEWAESDTIFHPVQRTKNAYYGSKNISDDNVGRKQAKKVANKGVYFGTERVDDTY